jgi:hypothetical protein
MTLDKATDIQPRTVVRNRLQNLVGTITRVGETYDPINQGMTPCVDISWQDGTNITDLYTRYGVEIEMLGVLRS